METEVVVGKKILKNLILLLSVLLCVAMTSCLSLLSTIEMVYNNAMDTREIDDREYAYGDFNEISLTFENGKMYATWDEEIGKTYKLTVRNGNESISISSDSPYYETGKINLTALGFKFNQKLTLLLDVTQQSYFQKVTDRVRYDYAGLTAEEYDAYTKPVVAGFSEIDYYIANRAEWFEFWSYLIIFRENYSYDDGVYEVESKVYMGYDFEDLYDTASTEDAFAYEVYSAIDAYEDSAAYTYSYEISENGKIGSIYMKFLYDFDPKYTSSSGEVYKNGTDKNDITHYTISPVDTNRKFKLDAITKTIKVSSSDQLYFAMKMGYKPEPVPGSNADYLYNEMRRIMSFLVTNETSDVEKVHRIYDYIVDTVIYDYDFTENIYEDDSVSINQLFSYRCLYMEGVFGYGNKTFTDADRVAICDGLSKAFLCLTRLEGIESLKISGTVNDDGHAWNKVKIGSVWYMVDTTWGNSLEEETNIEYLSHDYLLVPDDTRHEETPYLTYPSASTRYNFGPMVDNDPNDEDIRHWFPLFPGKAQYST